MPYVRKGKCVHKQNPDGSAGASVGCSDSVEEAKAHLKALYANVPDASKEAGDVPSTTYVHGPGGVLSQPGQTAPKKKKKKVTNAMITPKEFSKKYNLAEKDYYYALSESWTVASAINALSSLASIAHDETASNEASDVAEVTSLMRQLMSFMSDQLDEMDEAMTTPSDMMMYKDAQSQFLTTKEGEQYRWTLITGSAFEDRDGEIISEKALQDDCDQMELTGDYGELLWWHSDGTQHATDKEARPYIPLGICDISFVVDKCNIESGLYYDPEIGKVFSEKASKFGASKSFYHKEDEPIDGVYTYIRTKERSLLPRGKEANLLTKLFGLSKEKEMATNTERVDGFAKAVGLETKEEALDLAKALSEKADKFLASKEAKTPKKKKADDKEDKADEGKDEESESMKEFTETLTAMKESSDKLLLTLKEQSDAFTAYKEAKEKELDEVKANMAQVQSGLATLLGFQPKGANKFVASEQGKTKEKDEELVKKEKEALGFAGNTVDWIISGERPVAA